MRWFGMAANPLVAHLVLSVFGVAGHKPSLEATQIWPNRLNIICNGCNGIIFGFSLVPLDTVIYVIYNLFTTFLSKLQPPGSVATLCPFYPFVDCKKTWKKHANFISQFRDHYTWNWSKGTWSNWKSGTASKKCQPSPSLNRWAFLALVRKHVFSVCSDDGNLA